MSKIVTYGGIPREGGTNGRKDGRNEGRTLVMFES